MKIHVPMHITADWLGSAIARKQQARAEGKSTTFIKPKRLSIRDSIALAGQLKKS